MTSDALLLVGWLGLVVLLVYNAWVIRDMRRQLETERQRHRDQLLQQKRYYEELLTQQKPEGRFPMDRPPGVLF